MTDLLDVTLLVTDALDADGIRYTVGGSLASSFSGEPRASIDADILEPFSFPRRAKPYESRDIRPNSSRWLATGE